MKNWKICGKIRSWHISLFFAQSRKIGRWCGYGWMGVGGCRFGWEMKMTVKPTSTPTTRNHPHPQPTTPTHTLKKIYTVRFSFRYNDHMSYLFYTELLRILFCEFSPLMFCLCLRVWVGEVVCVWKNIIFISNSHPHLSISVGRKSYGMVFNLKKEPYWSNISQSLLVHIRK